MRQTALVCVFENSPWLLTCQQAIEKTIHIARLYNNLFILRERYEFGPSALPKLRRGRGARILLSIVLALVIGFAGGYGIREWISRRRRAAAREEHFRRRQQKLHDWSVGA